MCVMLHVSHVLCYMCYMLLYVFNLCLSIISDNILFTIFIHATIYTRYKLLMEVTCK